MISSINLVRLYMCEHDTPWTDVMHAISELLRPTCQYRFAYCLYELQDTNESQIQTMAKLALLLAFAQLVLCAAAMDCSAQAKVPKTHWYTPHLHLEFHLYSDPACSATTRTNPNGTPFRDADEVKEGNCKSASPFRGLDYWQEPVNYDDELCRYGNCVMHIYKESNCIGDFITLEHVNYAEYFQRCYGPLDWSRSIKFKCERNFANYWEGRSWEYRVHQQLMIAAGSAFVLVALR